MRTLLISGLTVHICLLVLLTCPRDMIAQSPFAPLRNSIRPYYIMLGFMPGVEVFRGGDYNVVERQYCLKYWGESGSETKSYHLLYSYPTNCKRRKQRLKWSNKDLIFLRPLIYRLNAGVQSWEAESKIMSGYGDISKIMNLFCQAQKFSFIHMVVSTELENLKTHAMERHNKKMATIACPGEWNTEPSSFMVNEHDHYGY